MCIREVGQDVCIDSVPRGTREKDAQRRERKQKKKRHECDAGSGSGAPFPLINGEELYKPRGGAR